MDAIQDILCHPAFPCFENEGEIRKKLEVLDLFRSLRKDIGECRFTVKAEPDCGGFVHYVECGMREDENYPDRDYVCCCRCVRVNSYTRRILNLLDEIHKGGCRRSSSSSSEGSGGGGESKINFFKSLFSCQSPWSHQPRRNK